MSEACQGHSRSDVPSSPAPPQKKILNLTLACGGGQGASSSQPGNLEGIQASGVEWQTTAPAAAVAELPSSKSV